MTIYRFFCNKQGSLLDSYLEMYLYVKEMHCDVGLQLRPSKQNRRYLGRLIYKLHFIHILSSGISQFL